MSPSIRLQVVLFTIFFAQLATVAIGAQSTSLRSDFHPLAPPGVNDRLEPFISLQNLETNIIKLQQQGLSRGTPAVKPWADSYWPHYLGGINSRYADEKFPSSTLARENYDYIKANAVSTYLPDRVNKLSPAEKYDLLIGATGKGLAQYVQSEVKGYMNPNGEIPIWFGICDGWAAAAQSGWPEPRNKVILKGAQGEEITFYQSDIKALTSWLWAKAEHEEPFSGTRCDIKYPYRNSAGRLTQRDCFDSNPMTWHLIMTHRIGRDRRNFVFDSSFGPEVWNYPVSEYSVSFFNPETLTNEQKFSDAIVPLDQIKQDSFARYRSPKAKYLIGVHMDVTHLKPTIPHPGTHGLPPVGTPRYTYDLELDQGYNIVGGEWRSEEHPDFIWSVFDNQPTLSPVDQDLDPSEWSSGHNGVPRGWLEPAKGQAKSGLPLSRIVQKLIQLSQ